MCHKRTYAPQRRTSSFNHLVGAQQESFRYFKAERSSGGEIDGEIEFGRLLDRYIAGLRPAQNLVDEVGGALEQSRKVRSVGHEPPGLDKLAGIEDCRQSRV